VVGLIYKSLLKTNSVKILTDSVKRYVNANNMATRIDHNKKILKKLFKKIENKKWVTAQPGATPIYLRAATFFNIYIYIKFLSLFIYIFYYGRYVSPSYLR
jgi:hypothetical protein